MNRKQLVLTIAALLIMGGGAYALAKIKANQRLGNPGVVTRPISDSQNVEVLLPERVLDFTSEFVPTDKLTKNVLPADTCFGARRYIAADSFEVLGSVVLMGSDRTSLHKPQYCLRGAGWEIVSTERVTIPVSLGTIYPQQKSLLPGNNSSRTDKPSP
jgi:hypothetical protein